MYVRRLGTIGKPELNEIPAPQKIAVLPDFRAAAISNKMLSKFFIIQIKKAIPTFRNSLIYFFSNFTTIFHKPFHRLFQKMPYSLSLLILLQNLLDLYLARL